MHSVNHIDDSKAKLVAKQLKARRETDLAQEAKDIANFYKKHYDYVEMVTCGNCKRDLCLFVLDREQVKQNMGAHPMGLRRIVLGITNSPLLSSRKRIDGTMGYRCICGADTIHTEAETRVIQEKGWPGVIPSQDPHIEYEIHKRVAALGIQPTIKKPNDHTVVVDGFIHTTLHNKLEDK